MSKIQKINFKYKKCIININYYIVQNYLNYNIMKKFKK